LDFGALIDEIAGAAHEAIEEAAAEAVRAALLAGLEREAAALALARRWRLEAEMRQAELDDARRNGRRNAVLATLAGVLGGMAAGVGGAMYFMRRGNRQRMTGTAGAKASRHMPGTKQNRHMPGRMKPCICRSESKPAYAGVAPSRKNGRAQIYFLECASDILAN